MERRMDTGGYPDDGSGAEVELIFPLYTWFPPRFHQFPLDPTSFP